MLDPIFTVGFSPDKFDNGYEGLNTALPFPDVSSLRVSGMVGLSPCSVAQSVKSFVLLADVMEKDLDLIDGVMLYWP